MVVCVCVGDCEYFNILGKYRAHSLAPQRINSHCSLYGPLINQN